MAAIPEKILWPIVGVLIFAIIAGFYIDDRRRLMEEGGSSKEHAGNAAENKQANNEHAGKTADKKPSHSQSENKHSTAANSTKATTSHSSQADQTASATSMDIDEYLDQSNSERNAELEANAAEHKGFNGGIDEYLSGATPTTKAPKNKQASNNASKQANNNQANGASSMSMDEYHAKTSGTSGGSSDSSSTGQAQNSTSGAYHGDLDGYLAKFGNGNQTPMKKQNADPFNGKEHTGFHGSYEDYAKKYN
jgi:hypothetical protein